MLIRCAYRDRCKYRFESTMCKTCKNNTARNMKEDFYIKATDNPIPDKCPLLTYSGPPEQTLGYECPVCGEHTNPYHLDKENHCKHCGYQLKPGGSMKL